MSTDEDDAGNDDLKSKMRQALERKQSNDPGVEHHDHSKGKTPKTHGPRGEARMHRRRSGGGGA